MARENQGLHVALIIFVVLTIFLAVSTFVFFSQYNDAEKRAQVNLERAEKADDAWGEKDRWLKEFQGKMGFAEDDNADAIRDHFNADMQTFAATFPEETARTYRQVIRRQAEVINLTNKSLADEQRRVAQFKNENAALIEATQKEIGEFKKQFEEANSKLHAEKETFKDDRERMKQLQARLNSDLKQINTDYVKQLSVSDGKIGKLKEKLKKKTEEYIIVKKTVDNMRRETPDRFHGEIRWVNDRHRMVWINLGRADALRPQTNFSVFAAGMNDISEAGRKASIEVTRILGSHLAEARVVDPNPTDPILIGDKIYTPVWSLGEKRHFALAGLIDLDNDGRSDLERMHTLIKMNGGVIDAPMDAQGERSGQMNMNTRYLVVGEVYKPTAPPELRQDYTDMKKKAEELQIEEITLGKFLELMGWVRQVKVASYTSGGHQQFPVERKGKPPTSDGRISELFKPRQPPRTGGGSAY